MVSTPSLPPLMRIYFEKYAKSVLMSTAFICIRPVDEEYIQEWENSFMTYIVHHFLESNGHKNRCLSCGTTENVGRRRYCSKACRIRLHDKLEARTGLVRALNTRYATFYFSEDLIVMDMLPYGSHDIYSFFYPRSPGRKPAEDFGHLADLLGDLWWAEKRRTNKRYVAAHHVLEQAFRNRVPIFSVKPAMVKVPSIRATCLTELKIDKSALTSPDLKKIVRNAYRRQAKEHHPDLGGNALKFRRLYRAYEELANWAMTPNFVKKCGFPDKWFYDGNKNRWIQPLPMRKPAEDGLRITG
jgi:hypothetical protein